MIPLKIIGSKLQSISRTQEVRSNSGLTFYSEVFIKIIVDRCLPDPIV
ncbi:hypothetical protein SAMN04488121_102445 [Chitinophaga filiformis]|uniref:Uncharacterized protein n=1 Tax=Chitinophaga filiformis TaxID=104663 RepID=A0A1G7MIG2_CHIFI|nr:hypothetical protein SAMN04488121_102445 [Chitinophaga filiformis]